MYFLNFPSIDYRFFDANQVSRRKTAINITNRMKLIEYVKKYKSNFTRYTVSDGERPDTLAHRLYERSDLHWIFYLANDMINPYTSWPMSNIDLDRYINEKYNGASFYTPDIWKPRKDEDNSTDFSIAYLYRVLDGFTLEDLTESQIENDFEPIAIENNFLLALTENSKVKVRVDGTVFETTVLKINSDFYEVVLDKKNWNLNFSDATENYLIYEVVNYGEPRCIRVPITRIVNERRYSANQFKYNEEYRDPNQVFTDGVSEYSTNPYAQFVHPFNSESINLGSFANSLEESFADVYAIKNTDGEYLSASYYTTNEDYELSLNESKRNILVPRPIMVEQVMKSLTEIFRS